MIVLNVSDWWQSLALIHRIYWCIAIPFSVLFLIQLVLTFIGGDIDGMDADGHSDIAIHDDTGIEFQFLTLKNLVAFFTIFGWTGIACLAGDVGTGITVIISFFAGFVMMLIMATLIYFMGKLVDSGTLNLNNAIGKIGSVYLTIPSKRSGFGKVQIQVQGLQTLDAMTDQDEAIKTGAVIEVVDILNNEILLVKQSSR